MKARSRVLAEAIITGAGNPASYNRRVPRWPVSFVDDMGFLRSRRSLLAAIAVVSLIAVVPLFRFGRAQLAHHGTANLRNANILLITLDTTRADHLGCYGDPNAETPNLDAFARDGVLFEHCITPTAYTLASHASIMTGLYPPAHGVRINGESALAASNVTLAERLSQKGYRTGAFIGAFVLDGRWGLSQGFKEYDDRFHLAANQRLDLAGVRRPANEVADAAIKWLATPSAQPFFAWVHFYDAHAPYAPPEPYKSRFAPRGEKALYDGGIAFEDSQVGRLLQWLDERGLREKTIVMIVGDHGEGLGEHGENEHGYYVYDYAVHVPLLLRIPGRPSAVRVSDQVRTIDLAPTLLGLVGAPVTGRMEGASLIPVLDGREKQPRTAYSESMAVNLQYGWAALYGLRTNEYKFIEAPRSELYDMTKDPREIHNALEENRRVALQLKDELARVREESARDAPKAEDANLDHETLQKLASLGYVGGASAHERTGANLADPKDKMHLFESVGYAGHCISIDDYKQAAEVLEIVLKDDPNVPQAQILLATTYRKLGRKEDAKKILDAYLRDDPGNVRALIAMAEILSEEGRRDDVMAICKSAIASDDRNARAYELMAEVYMTANEHASALPLLRKVTEIQPKLTRSRNNLAACLIALGQLDEADRTLHGILSEYPKFPLANYHLGLLREREGRLADARAAYEAELKNHPKTEAARFNLGDLLFRGGDATGAEKEMRSLIEQDAAAPKPYLFLARLLLNDAKRWPEAEKLAYAGLERTKAPDLKALGYFVLADVYSRQGRRADLQNAVRMGEHYRALIRG